VVRLNARFNSEHHTVKSPPVQVGFFIIQTSLALAAIVRRLIIREHFARQIVGSAPQDRINIRRHLTRHAWIVRGNCRRRAHWHLLGHLLGHIRRCCRRRRLERRILESRWLRRITSRPYACHRRRGWHSATCGLCHPWRRRCHWCGLSHITASRRYAHTGGRTHNIRPTNRLLRTSRRRTICPSRLTIRRR